ncbi:MAG: PQQ-binding-like beta-propeller repeat protein [Verrucomicrobiales bacterium]
MKFQSYPRLALAVLALTSQLALAADWPHWRGPQRTGISNEKGLLQEWPESGPKQNWVYKNAGNAYSGPAIVAGKLYTLGTRNNKEVLLALDTKSGKELWVTVLSDVLPNNWGGGPRSTPTVDGDKVYATSGPGSIVCVNLADGKLLWTKTMTDLGGKVPTWGYTESPLVDGDNLVVTPGGSKGTIAALNKKTGELVWQSKDIQDEAQYASIVPATINGEKQYVQLTMQNIFAVSPKDGSLLWKQEFPGKVAVIPTPIVHDNHVYVTAGYGVGCMLVKVDAGNKPKVVYENKVMKNHHGGVILYQGHVYGHSDGVGGVCQNLMIGEEVWSERNKLRKGAIGFADGNFLLLEEDSGTVAMIEASTKGYNEKGRFKLDPQSEIRNRQGRIWVHPVVLDGNLYLRDQDLIHSYSLKK